MNLRKLTTSAFTLAVLAGAPFADAAAGSTQASVTVTATLSPACTSAVSGSGNFSYTGMTNSAITATPLQTVTFTCTRGIALTGIAWDTDYGTNTSTGTTTPTAQTTGLIAGLVYSLDTDAPTFVAGAAGSGTTGATASTYTYTTKLTVAGNQPGDVGTSVLSTVTRTLTLSY